MRALQKEMGDQREVDQKAGVNSVPPVLPSRFSTFTNHQSRITASKCHTVPCRAPRNPLKINKTCLTKCHTQRDLRAPINERFEVMRQGEIVTRRKIPRRRLATFVGSLRTALLGMTTRIYSQEARRRPRGTMVASRSGPVETMPISVCVSSEMKFR